MSNQTDTADDVASKVRRLGILERRISTLEERRGELRSELAAQFSEGESVVSERGVEGTVIRQTGGTVECRFPSGKHFMDPREITHD